MVWVYTPLSSGLPGMTTLPSLLPCMMRLAESSRKSPAGPFRRPRLSIDTVSSNTPQDQYLAAYSADTRILNNHALKEHRRMRSKILHYLDNPEFALLILITPYATVDSEALAEPETTPVVNE